jgi:hypothetical protein
MNMVWNGYINGEAINPPEFESDAPVDCGECLITLDRDEDSFLTMDDDTIRCTDCRTSCQGCGEWVTDPNPIRLRCPAVGRLEDYCTPECAAQNFEEE